MLDIKHIFENKETVKNKLNLRGFNTKIIDEIYKKGKDLGKIKFEIQNLQSDVTKKSKEISLNIKDSKKVEKIKEEILKIKEQIFQKNEKFEQLNSFILKEMLLIPNLPLDDVPVGNSEEENVVISTHEKLGRGLVKQEISHSDIAHDLGIIDLPRAVKMSGSRFVIYKNDGAKLVRALQWFMLEEHISRGYEEYNIPLLVKSQMLKGTGQLPKFEEDLFKIANEDLYLIPTAEVSLTNVWNNEILNLDDPIKVTAFSECFRSEVGSGGKDNKGIIRNKQFKKVELVKIVKEEDIKHEFEKTLDDAKNILEKLEIPYRELLLCTGDLGFSSEQTIDLELWMPSENKFREVSSVSRFGDFQGRRAMIRYKNGKENKYAFTINGSGLAIDRLIAAIIENGYNKEDGSVSIPKALISYMQIDKITKRK
ncbi:serine--tRNA ligase [Mycoplasma sp. M5725]|uniref:Serine--tRNA ligase n=1 Tax=Mycoplasma phocimorsus TaxID=3045839 RepID=A0AAJ1UVZ7_9MOLU|nr:serine--tRNA ligase [Mycoplasma phocimorsus]MDJ1646064.1 serine--tRNA ligase [Mycoplasma phocimorsus]